LVTLVRESLEGGRIGELWPEGKVSVTQSPTRGNRYVHVAPKVGVGPERAHSGPTRTAVVSTFPPTEVCARATRRRARGHRWRPSVPRNVEPALMSWGRR